MDMISYLNRSAFGEILIAVSVVIVALLGFWTPVLVVGALLAIVGFVVKASAGWVSSVDDGHSENKHRTRIFEDLDS